MDEETDLEIVNFSACHIHMLIKSSKNSLCWHLTGFYGNPETSKRYESWQSLSKIIEYVKAPWCVVGDFNEIIFQDEKVGGRLRPTK